METFGDKIYQLRKNSNMTQEELAEMIDVSRQAISQWEANLLTPKSDKISALCEIFHVSADYLLSRNKEIHLENEIAISSVQSNSCICEETLKENNVSKKLPFKSKVLLGVILSIFSVVIVAVAAILICLFYNYEEGVDSVTSVVFGLTNGGLIAIVTTAAVLLICLFSFIAYKLIKKRKFQMSGKLDKDVK